MSIINRFFPIFVQNSNIITQDSGYSENVSLKNGGNSELRGNVYITNSGRLMINKNKDILFRCLGKWSYKWLYFM